MREDSANNQKDKVPHSFRQNYYLAKNTNRSKSSLRSVGTELLNSDLPLEDFQQIKNDELPYLNKKINKLHRNIKVDRNSRSREI